MLIPFIAEHSLFTKKVLSSRGICSLNASAEEHEVALIKGCDAFYSLLVEPFPALDKDLKDAIDSELKPALLSSHTVLSSLSPITKRRGQSGKASGLSA